MPLGTKYFDTVMIEQMNKIIRQVADEKRVVQIDEHAVFQRSKWQGQFTVDGVHLNAHAYKVFEKKLLLGVPASCNVAQ